MNGEIMKNALFFCFFLFFAFCPSLRGVEIDWNNRFVFYGDNTEFFEPFRTGETLLGQQGKSFFTAALGSKAFLSAGLFGDFRSVTEPTMTVKPLLSFEYREGGSRLVMGTLVTRDRHGFLEPLQVTTLEFTRPVEYGFQWIEEGPSFKCDLFLNWHQLNTPTEPEAFDYGGTLQQAFGDNFSLEEQLHGFHRGGQLYYAGVFNNWVPALGFRCRVPGFLGETRLGVFGVLSATLDKSTSAPTQWGRGGYLKASVVPGEGFEFFGIGWRGSDLYTQEGDAHYASFSDPDSSTTGEIHGFVRSDRFYAELGVKKEFQMEGGASFVAELRSHWIDEWWAYSYRLEVTVPLDIHLLTLDQFDKEKNNGDSSLP